MAKSTRQNSTASKRTYKRLFSKGGLVECSRCGVYFHRHDPRKIKLVNGKWLCVEFCIDNNEGEK